MIRDEASADRRRCVVRGATASPSTHHDYIVRRDQASTINETGCQVVAGGVKPHHWPVGVKERPIPGHAYGLFNHLVPPLL
jgi:hypothetical protein